MPLRHRFVEADAAVHQAAVDSAIKSPARRKTTKAQHEANQAFLTDFDFAPKHLQENEFIRRFYRGRNYNFKSSLRSLFTLHNETGNIWTHLIGFVIFIFLTYATLSLRPEPLKLGTDSIVKLEQRLVDYGKHNLYDLLQTAETWERTVVKFGKHTISTLEERLQEIRRDNIHELQTLRDTLIGNLSLTDTLVNYGRTGIAELQSMEERITSYGSETVRDLELAVHRALATMLDTTWPVRRWPIYVFLIGAMLCLLTSATCHLFGCCGAHVSAIIWRFDYAGIAILIVASFFPPVYYAFMCQPALRFWYLFTTSLLGCAVLGVTLLERFQAPELLGYRAIVFIALGSWGLVPVTHSWRLYNGIPEFDHALKLQLIMGMIYVVGALIYATRIPERWKPGAFDLAFQSHQIFHVAVVIAAMIHYKASNLLAGWRDSTGGCLGMDAY